ncbi:MAG: BatA and WFA domain-containing protein [Endomicrobiales bacterium]|nr:BatA and WFA domain-containing protein [Endomicrobiales bacterium]
MSISFLNPSYLWFLPLALGPLVIYFLYRKNPKKIEFSDLRFIEEALKRISRRLRFKQNLLLIVRMLIVLLLVLFFSRPVRHILSSGVSKEAGNIAVVLALDVSYSMSCVSDGRKNLEYYKDAGKKIIDLLPSSARIGVVVYSDRVHSATPVLSSDRNYLAGIIGQAKPTDFTTKHAAAFEEAQRLLGSGTFSNTTVVFLSDLAAHGFGAKIKTVSGKTRVIAIDRDRPCENFWIDDARLSYDAAAKHWQVEVTGGSHPAGKTGARSVSYHAGLIKVGEDFIKPGEDGRFRHVYSFRRGEGESCSGRVRIEQDALDADNVFHFAARRPGEFGVWLVDGDPKFGAGSESYYLRNIFPAAEVLTESEVPGASFNAPGVIILANVRQDSERVADFVKNGGGLIVFPGSNTTDEFSPPYLPASFGQRFRKSMNVTWQDAGFWEELGTSPEEFEWQRISVESGFYMKPEQGSRVLASLSDGWPFAVVGGYGSGRVVVFATSADRDWSNIVSKPVYAPLLSGLARHLSGTQDNVGIKYLKAGEVLRVQHKGPCTVVLPEGGREKCEGGPNEVIFENTSRTGVYAVLSDGKEVARALVNLDTGSDEGNTSRASSGEIRKYFSPNPVYELPENGWEDRLSAIIAGKEVSDGLLFAVLLLLAGEVLLSSRKRET